MQEQLLTQFRTLFCVISEDQPAISAAHLHGLLELFTPCGCDTTEAELFLKECEEGLSQLSFDHFLLYGFRLRSRIFASGAFDALPTDRAKVQAVVDRSDNLRRSKPLRRYERIFMRLHLAQQKEHRDKQQQQREQSPDSRRVKSPTTASKQQQTAKRRPATAAAPSSSSVAIVAVEATEEKDLPAGGVPEHWHGRFVASARRLPHRRVPLPPPHDKSKTRGRYDVHANRLAQDSLLVTDLRSMYDL